MKLIEPESSAEPPLLLAVDDQPENLRLLGNTLSKETLSLAFALSGEEALEWLEANKPDLILLDVTMPGIDGLECCRRLKTKAKFRDTPVIFLTARVETHDIEAGFQAGAVDYVAKPFRAPELIARVNTHLKLQTQRKELESNLEQKSELIGIIAHDVRGPISSIRGLAEMLLEINREESAEAYSKSSPELLELVIESSLNTLNILNELLNARISKSGEMEPKMTEFPLPQLFEDVRIRNIGQSMKKNIALDFLSGESPMVKADAFLLTEALDNLVSNSIKYSPPGKKVTVATITDDTGKPQLLVSDEGPGFQEEDYGRLFQRFQRLSAHPTAGETSVGLGLALVKELMQAQGGDVQLVSQPNESAKFLLTFARS